MSLIRRSLSAAGSQQGLTLIEVMFSALLVVLIGAAVVTGLGATAQISGDQRLRSQADSLAQQDQERLGGLSDLELTQLNQVPARSVAIDGTTYTITSSATYLNSSGGSSCSSASPGTAYYKILSDVSWPSNMRTDVREETVIARPIPGNLLVQVDDQTGTGIPGATVSATAGTTQSGATDSLGCATFEGLTSGQYTLAATDPGYVGISGATSASTVTSVPVTPPPTLTLGQAGMVAATFTAQGAAGATTTCAATTGLCTGQQAPALAWQGAGSTLSMSTPGSYTPATPGAEIPAAGPSSTIQLFPFAFTPTGGTLNYSGNYEVWAGPCAQMQPPEPAPPTAQIDKFSVAPGSSQTVTVQEPALDVIVDYNGLRVAPTAPVTLSFASTAAPVCPAVSWSVPVAPSAATDANGALLYPGQPYAPTPTSATALSVCAQYKPTPSSRTRFDTVKTANASFAAPTTVTIPITSTSTQTSC